MQTINLLCLWFLLQLELNSANFETRCIPDEKRNPMPLAGISWGPFYKRLELVTCNLRHLKNIVAAVAIFGTVTVLAAVAGCHGCCGCRC